VTLTATHIRPANQGDLPQLVQIYNHYVTNTHVTFDTQALAVAQRQPWFDSFSQTGPHRLLVAATLEGAVGYASSQEFRHKPAYATSVETTIYLDPGHVGRGIGFLLYQELLDTLQAEPGVHRAYGGIALPNPASIALHKRLGYREIGIFREVGYKFGKYWDVTWYEKDLSSQGYRTSRPDPV
jgi:phosphinothricin acetyltransferase